MSTKLSQNELKYWLSFNQLKTIGPVRFKHLMSHFPDLETAWQADTNELTKAGFNSNLTKDFIIERNIINPDQELEKVEKLGCQIVTILDQNYPELLKEIYAPPPLLYCFGQLDLNEDFTLAVVGSRKYTNYGKRVTEQIVGELAQVGLTIISGLALGIDALAHQVTVANKGKTVSVLGCGLDLIYPRSNTNLAKKILEADGSIISEFPLGTLPYKFNFPRRNRIIAGLALGTLIIEAAQKSGALITGRYALEQNREVMAIPGNIDNQNSSGTNNLIKAGAKVVTQSADILEVLNIELEKEVVKQIQPAETETEKLLLSLLSNEPIHIDKLARLAKLETSIINATLAVLEIKGLVKNVDSQNYIKLR